MASFAAYPRQLWCPPPLPAVFELVAHVLSFTGVAYPRWFCQFDRITERHGLHKVEIIGDAYYVVGNCVEQYEDHAERCASAALQMLDFMPLLRDLAGCDIRMRVGIHCGSVTAGVVGTKDPRWVVCAGGSGGGGSAWGSEGCFDVLHVCPWCVGIGNGGVTGGFAALCGCVACGFKLGVSLVRVWIEHVPGSLRWMGCPAGMLAGV